MTLSHAPSRSLALSTFLYNARVLTPQALQEREEPATSIEFVCGTILSVGRKKPSAPCARRIDLQGAFVLPGFVDAHTHLASYGASLTDLRLQDLTSAEALYEAVRQRASRTPPGSWILGRGWDESRWTPAEPPTFRRLSDLLPDHPVFLLRVDGHIALLNALALQKLGLDPARYADGLLKESELDAVRALFRGTPEARADAIIEGAREALRLGITCIHEMAHYEDILAYRLLNDQRRLPLRVYLIPYWEAWQRARSEGILPPPDGRWLWTRGVKFFADGSLGAHTALLSEPYADAVNEFGRHYEEPEVTASRIREVISEGYQPAIHCIGDAAIEWTLRVLEAESPRVKSLRPRLEHFELPTDAHLQRLKQLSGIASMQPNFTGQWGFPGGLYEQRLGGERLARMNPLWKLHRLGIPICLGSDTMPMSPVFGIRSAGAPPFRPQRLKVRDAIYYHTAGGAFASFSEAWLGALLPGYVADLVIMSAMPDEMGKVYATVVDGALAFASPDSPVVADDFQG
ncbi:MAG: amidohydrolase [bacterium JZ-2024 1]